MASFFRLKLLKLSKYTFAKKIVCILSHHFFFIVKMASSSTTEASEEEASRIPDLIQMMIESIRRGNLQSMKLFSNGVAIETHRQRISLTIEQINSLISTAMDPGNDFRNNEQFEANQLEIIEYLLKPAYVNNDHLKLVGERGLYMLRTEKFRLKQQKLYQLLLDKMLSSYHRYTVFLAKANIIKCGLIYGSLAGCDDIVLRALAFFDSFDWTNNNNNTVNTSINILQFSLTVAAYNGYASVVQILAERLGQTDGRNACFHFKSNSGIYLPLLQKYVWNGKVIKYLLSTATDLDTEDGIILRNPQTNTMLLLCLVRRMLMVDHLRFTTLLQPDPRDINHTNFENMYCASLSDNIEGLLYIFNHMNLSKMMFFANPIDPTNPLSPPTFLEHQQTAIWYAALLKQVAEFDRVYNNSDCRSDIIRLLYAIVFHGKRVPKSDQIIVAEIVPAVDFSLISVEMKKWMRSYIMLDVQLMLSELTWLEVDSVLAMKTSFLQSNVEKKEKEKAFTAMSSLVLFDAQEIAKSKQAIMLRYFNNMFGTPEEQFPKALTIDEKVLLAGNRYFSRVLLQRDPFRLLSISSESAAANSSYL